MSTQFHHIRFYYFVLIPELTFHWTSFIKFMNSAWFGEILLEWCECQTILFFQEQTFVGVVEEFISIDKPCIPTSVSNVVKTQNFCVIFALTRQRGNAVWRFIWNTFMVDHSSDRALLWNVANSYKIKFIFN